MTTTIPRLSLLTSLSSGAFLFVVLDQQWQWDGNVVAVVNKAGGMADDGGERDGAPCCDNNDNHPYPVVANIVIIWRLHLCSDGMTMAVAGWQQGGKDRGSGCHGLAVVGRGS
jgi:hypothetical protein